MGAVRKVLPLLWPSDALLAMPGSSSESNRALVAAALYGRSMTISGATPSDDVRHMANGLAKLGFVVTLLGDTVDSVRVGARRADAPRHGELFCGNAATALSFLVSVAAITPGEWTITGDEGMRRPPIGPLVEAWRRLGVDIVDTNGCPPVRVHCHEPPRGGMVRIAAGMSRQLVTSLMLVGAALRDGLRIEFDADSVSLGDVEMTRGTLRAFGVRTELTPNGVSVVPGSVDRPATYGVGADAGSAGTWLCLNHLTRSTIRVHPWNLRNPPDEQGHVHPDEGLADELSRIPASGDLTIDVGAMPEQFMNLAIVAAHRAGTTRLVGGTNLRIEESDRIAVMARELHNVGVDVDELPDGLVVRGGKPLRSAIVDPDNDHRVAMAFALAGLMSPGISIANPECVARSHPGFWDDLERVRTQRRCIAVVGMRGAGKSTFARAFAAATECGLREIDDRLIEGLGPIEVSMATYGWTALRKREERLVGAALAPNGIVSLRGAAVESSRARELLRSSTSVIWLDCDATLLRARIAADAASRSSVTGAPVLDEIPALLARRNPLYAEVADVRIDAALPTDQQVESTLLALGASCRWPGSA